MNPDTARAISLLGHPLAVLPVAAMLLAGKQGAAAQAAWIGVGLLAFAVLVLAGSWRQVRAGRWAHVDASEPHERRTLNLWLLCAMAPGAAVAWWQGNGVLAAGLGVSAGVILVALLLARWCKLSLHVAFAVLATMMVSEAWPWAGLVGVVFACLVAWSRLVLQRHRPRDLVVGALAGGVAGLVFLLASRALDAG